MSTVQPDEIGFVSKEKASDLIKCALVKSISKMSMKNYFR